jgi:post-segregation antitoxin (ccd killing protein)
MSANPLTFRVNPILRQQLNERARKLGINRSKLIVTAIREYLDKQAKTPAV